MTPSLDHEVSDTSERPVHDLVGVGFGPSNLGLAIALRERRAAGGKAPTGLFLERQERFSWHQGMLLDDATMQISFLKDLVTPRNPASDFSFLSFLHRMGRLHDFINHKTLFPLRAEFHDYLVWCAQRVSDQVRYGQHVVALRPVTRHGKVVYLDVVARDTAGRETVERARNVVLAPGLRPSMPEGVHPSDRVWHSDTCYTASLTCPQPRCTVSRWWAQDRALPKSSATSTSGSPTSPSTRCSPATATARPTTPRSPTASSTPRQSMPTTAPPRVQRRTHHYHRNTNYSAVDPDLIANCTGASTPKVRGKQRLQIHNMTRVVALTETDDRVDLTWKTRPAENRPCSRRPVVYATGYQPVESGRCSATSATTACSTPPVGLLCSATTGSSPTTPSPAACTCRAAPSTRTGSPRCCCPTSPPAPPRSSTPSKRAAPRPNHCKPPQRRQP